MAEKEVVKIKLIKDTDEAGRGSTLWVDKEKAESMVSDGLAIRFPEDINNYSKRPANRHETR
jgi:hypothetical protein